MNFRALLGIAVLLAVTGSEAPAARDAESGLMLPVELSDIGYLQVTNAAVPITVPRTQSTFGIGESVPLIQKNMRYFIGLARHDDGFQELVAFRRVLHSGQGTAWVTEQKDLVFGAELQAEAGQFYLHPTEMLPIVAETDDSYRVLCERENYTFALAVPRKTEGIRRLDELPEQIVKRVEQMERMKQRVVMTPPATGSVLDLATAELEADSLSLDPMARMLKATKPEPKVVEQNWYEARVADMPELAEPVVESPKPKPPARLRPPPQPRRPAPVPPPAKVELPQEPEPAIQFAEVAPPIQPVVPAPVTNSFPAAIPVAEPIKPVADPVPVVQPSPPPAPAPAPAPAPVPAPARIPDAGKPPAPATQPLEEVASPEASESRAPPAAKPKNGTEQAVSGVAQAALRVLLLLVVLTVVFLGAIFMLAKFVNRAPRPTLVKPTAHDAIPAEEPAMQEVAISPPPVPTTPTMEKPPADGDTDDLPPNIQSTSKGGTFTGSLHGFHISELIQFLNSSKETGTLTISENNNPTQSRVMFEGGEIFNAYYGHISGEAAVAEILRFDDGFFVFSRQVVGGCERVITQSTMSLLMTVHQSIDEATMDPDGFDADLFMLGSTDSANTPEESQPIFGQ